jgi:glucose-1-phosphatase
MENIRNIICDLGGVFYSIDHRLTKLALAALSHPQSGAAEIPYSLHNQAEIFSLYECGRLGTLEFRERIRALYHHQASDLEIDRAWNAMLLHLNPGALNCARILKGSFRTVLLSNINPLHYEAIVDECWELFSQFEYCFFSHECGMRKPQPEIYRLVLQQKRFLPEQTLLIDDSPANIDAAHHLGLQTYLIDEQHTLSMAVETLLRRERSVLGPLAV